MTLNFYLCLLSLAVTLASALTGGGRCGALSGSPAQREGMQNTAGGEQGPGTQMQDCPLGLLCTDPLRVGGQCRLPGRREESSAPMPRDCVLVCPGREPQSWTWSSALCSRVPSPRTLPSSRCSGSSAFSVDPLSG